MIRIGLFPECRKIPMFKTGVDDFSEDKIFRKSNIKNRTCATVCVIGGSSGCHDVQGMGTRPVVQSVTMIVWAPWVRTWVVSIKITKTMTLVLALRIASSSVVLI
ncbi:hypothetical protein TNCV_2214861 [Trichonephila clavipes]|nr:hypothetical protein TNCV_2214861 [Trichonephila clavipes]